MVKIIYFKFYSRKNVKRILFKNTSNGGEVGNKNEIILYKKYNI